MDQRFSHIKLSDAQIELLMDCHERQLMKQEPGIGPHLMQQTNALVKWGLLEPGIYRRNNKRLMRFFITPLGIEFLCTL